MMITDSTAQVLLAAVVQNMYDNRELMQSEQQVKKRIEYTFQSMILQLRMKYGLKQEGGGELSQVKGINPGRLKQRVTIMRYQESEDELGNTVNTLAPLKSCWAEFRPVRGKEQLEYYKTSMI